jgi:hypothetical protein
MVDAVRQACEKFCLVEYWDIVNCVARGKARDLLGKSLSLQTASPAKSLLPCSLFPTRLTNADVVPRSYDSVEIGYTDNKCKLRSD